MFIPLLWYNKVQVPLCRLTQLGEDLEMRISRNYILPVGASFPRHGPVYAPSSLTGLTAAVSPSQLSLEG